MARTRAKRERNTADVQDYRHDAKRKNNPPVGMVTYEPKVKEVRKQAYAYNPHLSPQLVWARKAGLKQIEVEEQAAIDRNAHPRIKAFMARIRSDALMQVEEAEGKVNLLKTTASSQLCAVFGEPDVDARRDDDDFIVALRGVGIYNPLAGEVHSDHADKIAAWRIDTDYDGRAFCVCQTFFPRQIRTRATPTRPCAVQLTTKPLRN
jgi:hypothetical protein